MLTESDLIALYERYLWMVQHRAMTLVRDKHAAEDVAQETFLRYAQYARTHPVEKPKALLYRICTNVALKRLQRQRDVLDSPVLQSEPAPEKVSAEERVLLNQLLATCSGEEADLAVMYYVDNMSHDEIALVAGLSRRTIGNRLRDLHERLQRMTVKATRIVRSTP